MRVKTLKQTHLDKMQSKSDKAAGLSEGYIGKMFLDSGAHAIYTREVIRKKHKEGYDFYNSQTFWDYVDAYANFIKKYKTAIDWYVNVDAIFQPETSYKVLKYLENTHKLNPMPVVHWGTDIKWLKKYMDDGYTYIGLGGLGQEVTKKWYYNWADNIFRYICPKPTQLPIIRVHGFAMTAYDLLVRYPWRSVDSASWVKAGGFGQILVPHKRNNKYTFDVSPYSLSVSIESPTNDKEGRNYSTLTKLEQRVIREWLEIINIPIGKADSDGKELEWGIICSHHARRIANILFFEKLVEWLPEWPWPFKLTPKRRLSNV